MPKFADAPAVAPPIPFRPPAVEVGQVVLWQFGPDSGERPGVGVVTRVTPMTVNLAMHVDGMLNHVMRTGVRHRDDPHLRQMPEHDAGVWDLTPRDRLINALLESLSPGD